MGQSIFDANRTKTLLAVSTISSTTPVAITGTVLTDATALSVAIVDGNGDQITSFGGGTQYANGDAVATPTGTAALGFDGTNVRVLKTQSDGTLYVTGGGGGTQYAVGAVAGATDTGTLALVVRDDALSTLGDADGDYVQLRVGSTGALWSTFTNTTIAVTSATFATLAEQQTQTIALGTLLTSANFAAAFGTAGTADSQVMSVQGIASMTPVQVSQATATNLNAQVVGTVADDTAASGNPVVVGGIAKSPDGTDPSSVAENDTARLATDLNRRLYVNTVHPRHGNFHSNGSSALTDTSVVADPGDGFQVVLTSIIFSTGAATACNIFFEEGGTTILGPWYLEAVAGRGVFWKGEKFVTASTAVTVTTSAAIAQSLDVDYYIQAV